MSLAEQITDILLSNEKYPDEVMWDNSHCTIRKITSGIEIDYGKMYSAPTINFGTLFKLSELFGTKEIDVDNYSQRGCDTCDYGSSYGHTIQILFPSKNLEEVQKLIGKDIIKL